MRRRLFCALPGRIRPAVTDLIDDSQPVIHTHVEGWADIMEAIAAQGFEDVGTNRTNPDALAERL